jgi:hypothetical protein
MLQLLCLDSGDLHVMQSWSDPTGEIGTCPVSHAAESDLGSVEAALLSHHLLANTSQAKAVVPKQTDWAKLQGSVHYPNMFWDGQMLLLLMHSLIKQQPCMPCPQCTGTTMCTVSRILLWSVYCAV